MSERIRTGPGQRQDCTALGASVPYQPPSLALAGRKLLPRLAPMGLPSLRSFFPLLPINDITIPQPPISARHSGLSHTPSLPHPLTPGPLFPAEVMLFMVI